MTLNIGMIGAGFIGQLAHLMNFIEVPRCKVLALAEFKPELRRKVAVRFEIPKTYPSHLDLINDPEVDAVVVVTPRPFIGPIVYDCLTAGKHVLSEKPMVGSLKQAKLLLDAARSKQARYAVGYMKRFDEGVAVAKEALQNALETYTLGTILSVHATCYMGNSYCNPYGHITTQETVDSANLISWGIAPDWLPQEFHLAFGAYLNTYSHVTNLLRFLFEETPTVDFVNLTDHPGQLTVLRFKQFLATLQTGKMSHRGWSEEIRITFTDGEITLLMPPALLRNVPATVEIYKAGNVQEKISPLPNWSWAFRRQAESFVADILDQKPMRNSAEEAAIEIELIENLWRMEIARLGKSIQMENIHD